MRSLDIVWQFLGNPDKATRDAIELGAILFGAAASIATLVGGLYRLIRWLKGIITGKKPARSPRDRGLILRLRKEGWRRYRLKEYGPAIVAFDEAIRLHEHSANAYHGRGLCRFQRSEFGLAVEDFDNFAAIVPSSPAAFYNRALAYDRLGQRSNALKDLDRVLLLRPNHQNALAGRTKLLNSRPPFLNLATLRDPVLQTRVVGGAIAAIVLLLIGAAVIGSLQAASVE